MENRNTILAVLALAVAVLAGYTLLKDRPEPPGVVSRTPDLAAEETIEFVAMFDKIHPDKIELVDTEEVEWPNSCLGLPKYDEMCAQAIVPGYRIVLNADGERMIFRTNRDGSSIRRDAAAEGR